MPICCREWLGHDRHWQRQKDRCILPVKPPRSTATRKQSTAQLTVVGEQRKSVYGERTQQSTRDWQVDR